MGDMWRNPKAPHQGFTTHNRLKPSVNGVYFFTIIRRQSSAIAKSTGLISKDKEKHHGSHASETSIKGQFSPGPLSKAIEGVSWAAGSFWSAFYPALRDEDLRLFPVLRIMLYAPGRHLSHFRRSVSAERRNGSERGGQGERRERGGTEA